MFRRARGFFSKVRRRGAIVAERLLGAAGDSGAMTGDATFPSDPAANTVVKPGRGLHLKGQTDIAVAAGLAVVAAIVAFSLPAGNLLRAALALPILLLVPGYLLIEASVSSVKAGQRGLHALVAIGVSPPLVGLLALATAIVPGGFHTSSIILTVTVACLALGFVAAWRRVRAPAMQQVAPLAS
jgi:uncharacterized membrane protein